MNRFYIPFLLLVFPALTHVSFGQTNTSAHASECLLSGTHVIPVDLDDSGVCIGGATKLYFHMYVQDGAGFSVGGSWTVSSGTLTYKVYGPFDELSEGHALVTGGYVSPIASSTTPSSSQTISFLGSYASNAVYIIEVGLSDCSTELTQNSVSEKVVYCQPTGVFADQCEDCIGGFQPLAGKYVFSAWTKEEEADVTKTSYDLPSVDLTIYDGDGMATPSFTPSGEIIDGWQQITGVFEIHGALSSLQINFTVGGSGESALFDDIRIFPFDGSMMTYVYDPVTLRLVAELDERNYAKLYEYDEEGKLVRVKKETEKGVMTITESRENTVKRP